MKNTFRIIVASITCAVVLSACSHTTIVKVKNPPPGQAKKAESGKSLPPGQAKKATGSKSAKEFAPGQQKKTSKNTKGKNK